MTVKQAAKLDPGVYEVTWKKDKRRKRRQPSLAAIGKNYAGKPWIAPCDFTEFEIPIIHPTLWSQVKSVILIQKQELPVQPGSIPNVKAPKGIR